MKKLTKDQKRKRRLKGMREAVRGIKVYIKRRQLSSQGKYIFPDKIKKAAPPLKPYRLILLQRKLEKLEAEYRGIPHEAKREREKVAEKITLLKSKLGKKINHINQEDNE